MTSYSELLGKGDKEVLEDIFLTHFAFKNTVEFQGIEDVFTNYICVFFLLHSFHLENVRSPLL